MNKTDIYEFLKNDPFYKNLKVDDMEILEFFKKNYTPWTFELFSDKNKIHETWFPNKDRNSITGDYFGLYPSLPMWPNEFFSIDGRIISEEELNFNKNYPGTGASLFVYNKK